jgi:hypothetical protein
MVGRELGHRWKEALRQQRQVDEEFERRRRLAPARLSVGGREAIRSLAADPPAVWRSGTTTPADRQRIARPLLERVVVTVDKAVEGFRPPKRTGRSTGGMMRRLLAQLGLTRRERAGGRAGLGRDERRPGELARQLNISRYTMRRWRRVGWVHRRRDQDGHWIIWADADEIARLRELYALPRTWGDKARPVELIEPKPRPPQAR